MDSKCRHEFYPMSADQLTHRNKISFLHGHLCLWNRPTINSYLINLSDKRLVKPATLVAGLAIGAVLTTALRAQGMPPAYVVAEVAIHDGDAFARDYAPRVAGTLQRYGGRFLTSGKLTALE